MNGVVISRLDFQGRYLKLGRFFQILSDRAFPQTFKLHYLIENFLNNLVKAEKPILERGDCFAFLFGFPIKTIKKLSLSNTSKER